MHPFGVWEDVPTSYWPGWRQPVLATRKDDRRFIGVNTMKITKILKFRRQWVSAACYKLDLHYFSFT